MIDQGSGAVAVRSTYRDIKVYGPSQFVLRHVKYVLHLYFILKQEASCFFRIDMDKNRMRIKLWLPHLELISQYTMEGRILMMPIAGTGVSRGNYCNFCLRFNILKFKKCQNKFYFYHTHWRDASCSVSQTIGVVENLSITLWSAFLKRPIESQNLVGFVLILRFQQISMPLFWYKDNVCKRITKHIST